MAKTKEEALESIRTLIQLLEREGVDDNGVTKSVLRLIEEHGVESAKAMVELIGVTVQSDPDKRQMVDNILKVVF